MVAVKEAKGAHYVIRTTSKMVVESLLKLDELTDGTKIEVIPHPNLNIVQEIIYDTDTINIETEEILKELSEQNVIQVRRITKMSNGVRANTPLLVITFSGSYLPPYVYFGLVRVSVRQYYASPLQCFNCGRLGHGSKNCHKPRPICLNCGEEHVIDFSNPCTAPSKCVNCYGEHSSRNKRCPIFEEEVKIIKVKTDKRISFTEARAMLKRSRNQQSYANVTHFAPNNEQNEKDKIIESLRSEIQQLRSRKPTQNNTDQSDAIIQELRGVILMQNEQLNAAREANNKLSREISSLKETFLQLSQSVQAPKEKRQPKPSGMETRSCRAAQGSLKSDDVATSSFGDANSCSPPSAPTPKRVRTKNPTPADFLISDAGPPLDPQPSGGGNNS